MTIGNMTLPRINMPRPHRRRPGGVRRGLGREDPGGEAAQVGELEAADREGAAVLAGDLEVEEAGVGAFVGGIGSFFHVIWTPEEVRDYRTVATGDRVLAKYFSLDLMNRGVFLLGHPNVSAVTTDEDLDFTLDTVRRSVDELKPIIKERAPRLLTK